jgi:hypothetical protein
MRYRLLIPVLSVFLAACAQEPPAPTSPGMKLPAPTSPGMKLIEDEQAVWSEYKCDSKKLPFIVFERDEISPSVVKPAQEFTYHFIYAVCTLPNQKTIKGNLGRKLHYKGQVVFQDIKKDFELNSGKWDVTSFIKVPSKAQAGTYNFELTFSSPVVTVTRSTVFTVKK